jgi:hypothetical protein
VSASETSTPAGRRAAERDRPITPVPPATETPAPARRAEAASRPHARRARLLLTRVDPWSVMKLAFLLSIALGIMLVTAVALVWLTLDSLGVFDAVNRTATDVTQGPAGGGLDIRRYVAFDRVLGATGILAVVNVVLLTALATLGAFLYNLATSLVGGLQVTLTEDT